MSRHGGYGEPFNIMVIQFRLHADIIGIIAQP